MNLELPRVLTVWSMVGLIFFEVSGGSYGIEPVVRKAGHPLYAIVGLLVTPFVWSAPIALMTAEMCSAFPHVGGKIYFVQQAFGSYIGWLNGAFNAVSNIFDVATLPAMAVGYAKVLLGEPFEHFAPYFARVMILAACILNCLGIELVGTLAQVLTVVVCLPFVVIILLGVPSLPGMGTEHFLTQSMSPLKFISCLLWNMSGYDDAGATAAEIANPQDVYPKSLTISLFVVSLSYVLPVIVGLAVLPAVASWRDGAFVDIGSKIGGPVLAAAVAFLGVVSSFGQLVALYCSSVREIVCLGELRGQPVPQCLASLHPRFLTPHRCTIVFGCVLCLLVDVEFTTLIAASMFFDCFSFCLQFAAWVKHRADTPQGYALASGADRQVYRSFLGTTGVVVVSIFPIMLCLLVLVLTLQEQGFAGIVGFASTMIVSSLIYAVYVACGAHKAEQMDQE